MNRYILVFVFVLSLPLLAVAQDSDGDGLSDDLENSLLHTHRPRLYYDAEETRWPVSILDLVTHSSLRFNISSPDWNYGAQVEVLTQAQVAANPCLILRGNEFRFPGFPSSMTGSAAGSPWCLGVDESWYNGVFPGGGGENHRGMYGHCVPTQDGQILLQYWQLFAFNEATCFDDCGDHEGDWIWIDVYLDGISHELLRITFHHHGDDNCSPVTIPCSACDRGSLPYRDIVRPLDGVPECFLEHQAHEWWPFRSTGAECDFDTFGLCENPTHRGDSIVYRVPSVLNVGERWAPLPGNLEAELLMLFNGYWGAWGSECWTPTNPHRDFKPADSPILQSSDVGGRHFPLPPNRYAVYVYTRGSDSRDYEHGGGSRFLPYRTLSHTESQISSGGTIFARPGTYSQPATIRRSITIRPWTTDAQVCP